MKKRRQVIDRSRRNVISRTFVPLLALVLAWLAPVSTLPAQAATPSAEGPIPVNVLLLIPDRFEQFTFTSFIKGRETDHPFGEQAQEQLTKLLGPEFLSLDVRPVKSEAAVQDILSSDSSESAGVRTYDYVIVPKVVSVNYWSRTFQYRFEIEIQADLYATSGSTVTKIRGYGQSTVGNMVATTPLFAGNRAIIKAVEAIRDGIEGRRDLFVPASGPVASAPPAVAQLEAAAPYQREAPPEVEPVPVSVLLLIPDEFSRFVYSSAGPGGMTDHVLGEEAEDELDLLLKPEFQSLIIRPVSNRAAAMDMLSPDSPDYANVSTYDYIAIPELGAVESWTRGNRMGFSVEVYMDFYSPDGSRKLEFKGSGDLSAGLSESSSPTPVQWSRRALESAIRAIRESIDRRRDLFTS